MKKITRFILFFFAFLLFVLISAYFYEYNKRMNAREVTLRKANLEYFYRILKEYNQPPKSLYEASKELNIPIMYFIYYYERPRNIIEEPFPKNPTQKEFDQLCQYKLVHLKDGKWYIVELVSGYRIKKRFLITNEGTIREANSN